MKLTVQRVLIFFLLIALSVGFGFAFDAVADAVERSNYPRPDELRDGVSDASARFGLPEAILWAAVRERSGFQSNLTDEDGGIGLFRLTPERYTAVRTEVFTETEPDPGLLYNPSVNLLTGAAYLSLLYEKYGVFETVYAAMELGEETVDAYLTDPDHVTAQGTLTGLPKKAAATVAAMEEAVETYTRLYY